MSHILFEILHVSIWIIIASGLDVLISKLYKKFMKKDLHELISMAAGFTLAIPFCPAWYVATFWVVFVLSMYGMYLLRDAAVADKRMKWQRTYYNVMTFAVVLVFVGVHQFVA